METITVTIDRANVLQLITNSTAYTGNKFAGDDSAYERISTKEVDRDQLLQLWNESAADVAEKFHGVLISQGRAVSQDDGDTEPWEFLLEVSSNFDPASTDGIAKNLTSFFINSILGKWFAYTNKGEAGAYADHAMTFLNAAHSLVYVRKKPRRPVIVDSEDTD